MQPGTGQIWLDDVQCRGDELTLDDCAHRGWAVHNCDHKEDVGIHCGITTTARITTTPEAPVISTGGTDAAKVLTGLVVLDLH